ncbi:MAG: hypothetical protein RL091_3713 [Verrucomicrobiota bacterium]|jgi:hypothetical protein
MTIQAKEDRPGCLSPGLVPDEMKVRIAAAKLTNIHPECERSVRKQINPDCAYGMAIGRHSEQKWEVETGRSLQIHSRKRR